MFFECYSGFRLDVALEEGRRVACRIGIGTRVPARQIRLASELTETKPAFFLADLLYEYARQGGRVFVLFEQYAYSLAIHLVAQDRWA